MPPFDPSDHDLLILLNRDMAELKDQLRNDNIEYREQIRDILKQLERGNERFSTIAMRDQEVSTALAGLRLDFSRALQVAEAARDSATKVQGEIRDFKIQMRTILWLGGPMIGISVALATELLKRWLGL